MKKLRVCLLLIVMIPCIFLFGGCETEPYVVDIKKTDTIGTIDTYTVYYSDNSTSNFTVENGTDGEDGADLTMENIFDSLVDRGIYTDTNEDYLKFLSEYLNFSVEENSIKDAVVNAMPSVVSIFVEHPEATIVGEFPHLEETVDSKIYCGAGVVYEMNEDFSYVITNFHVVYNYSSEISNKIARLIYAYPYGQMAMLAETDSTDALTEPTLEFVGDGVECTFIGGSMNYDIAILKVSTNSLKAVNPDAKAVTIADGYSLADTAIAIGNPEGDGVSVTSGIVSVVSEEITMTRVDKSGNVKFRVMRIDTAINGGNSGGGLFNDKGELIGIVNSKLTMTANGSTVDNIAYALPYDNVTKVAENIIDQYESSLTIASNSSYLNVLKLYLGVSVTSENTQTLYNYKTDEITISEDVLVVSVEENLLAERKGIKEGDIITSIVINDTEYEINRYYELSELLLMVRVGDNVLINVARDNLNHSIVLGTITSDMMITIV